MNSVASSAPFDRHGPVREGVSRTSRLDAESSLDEQPQLAEVDPGNIASWLTDVERDAASMVAQFRPFRASARRVRRSEDLERILDSDAEEKLGELDMLFTGGKFALATLMKEARHRFRDGSDLMLALRELRRRRYVDGGEVDGVEQAIEALVDSGEGRQIKAGINVALKAKVFGARMRIDPSMLRELYRQFLDFDGPCLVIYQDWIDRFGVTNRKRILDYVGVALMCDMQSLDPSCNCAAEFGPLIDTLSWTRMLSSADDVFVGRILEDALMRECKFTEACALATLLGGLQRPFAMTEVMLGALGDVLRPLSAGRRSQLLQFVLRGFASVPIPLFGDGEGRTVILTAIEAMIGRMYRRERQQARLCENAP
jgi:type III secretion protein W